MNFLFSSQVAMVSMLLFLLTNPVFSEGHSSYPCEKSEEYEESENSKLIPHHPLSTKDFVYTRGYVDTFSGSHKGIDIATESGNAIVAVWDGVATVIKWDNDIVGQSETGGVGFGYYLIVSNHHGSYSFYGHLLPNSVPIRVGAKVTAGMVIALSGNSGTSSGPHLHYAEKNLNEEWIDPTWVIHTAHQKYHPLYPVKSYPAFLQDHLDNRGGSYCKEIQKASKSVHAILANKNKKTSEKSTFTAKTTGDSLSPQINNKNNSLLLEKPINQQEAPDSFYRRSRLWRPEGNVIKE